MTNKNSDTINISIEPILKITNCLCIECDSGSEFTNKKFKDLLKQYKIKIIYVDVGNHNQLGIVDRFCRTIRNLINKYLAANNTTNNINFLPDLVLNYNNSYHKGIDGIPVKYNEDRIKQINMENQNKAKQEETIFQIGDNIRYIINRVAFAKARSQNGQQQFTK